MLLKKDGVSRNARLFVYLFTKKGFKMAVEFYDVKTRKKVKIDDKNVMKTTFKTKNGQTRYGVRGKTADGRMLTKFVSKADWDKMSYPQEKK
jgi:hypothetical protein